MKNQYFGDVNDYLKYGLLRLLGDEGRRSLAVCWMLTPDDGCGDGRRGDGRFIGYLEQPEEWRSYDPPLYDTLRDCLHEQGERCVRLIQRSTLFPATRFFDRLLPDDGTARASYFEAFWQMAAGCDLIFFDPDNGMEVKSKPYARKGSSKYLYWRELRQTLQRGHTALVYQHFRREKRDHFVARMADEMRQHAGAEAVTTFRTKRVVFFLVGGLAAWPAFEPAFTRVEHVWGGQITVQHHTSS